jgi:hypothetical protein
LAGALERVGDEIMGHASGDMGRRYAHVPRSELFVAVDRLPFRAVTRGKPVERLQNPVQRDRKISELGVSRGLLSGEAAITR